MIGRVTIVVLSVAIAAMAGCKQGTGEACVDNGDCDPGLICDFNAFGGPVCRDSLSPPFDAAPPLPDAGPDAMPWTNGGFVEPTEVTTAYRKVADAWVNQGDADWTCLGSISPLAPASAITVAGTVRDVATQFARSGVVVTAYDENDFEAAPLAEMTSDMDGNFSLGLPDGFTRVGLWLGSGGALDTVIVNALFYDAVPQEFFLPLFSTITASSTASLDGGSRTSGTAQIAGQVYDCSWNRVANAVVTVSAVSGSVVHVPEVTTFYGTDDEPSIAVPHPQRLMTGIQGTFHTVEITAGDSVYVQAWGYTAGQTPGVDSMTLLDEFHTPTYADTVMMALMGPLRTYD